jgi:quercetin dioxygenase-like cupin family protein
MVCYHDKIEKQNLGPGILLQEIGIGQHLNALHWNMSDKSEVKLHTHPQEQFGYVIKGGFNMVIGDENMNLKAGDSYFIPPDMLHSFIAVGETEAIDVFSPVKKDFPWKE